MYEKTGISKIKTFLIFAGPALLAFVAVVIVPFIYGVYLTFTNWNGISTEHSFVGFNNYIQVFLDVQFWSSLWLTIRYVFFSVVLINVIAFALAYCLTSGLKAQNFFRTGFFTPNLIGGVVLGFIWQFVFSNVLVSLGSSWGISSMTTSWLSDPVKAFWTLVIVSVWQSSGYMMLIYVAGFTSISTDLIEASKIDGCTGWQTTRHIVVPLMVPSFVICLFLSLSRCFMVYDLNLSLTKGDPYGTTQMAAMYVYQKAFTSQQYGIGQAEAFFLFLVVAIVSVTQIYIGKRKEVEA